MSITFTQQDLDNLKAALVTGASQVRIGDRTVVYRSQKEILEAIKMIQEFLETDSDDESPDLVQATFSRGNK